MGIPPSSPHPSLAAHGDLTLLVHKVERTAKSSLAKLLSNQVVPCNYGNQVD